MDFLHKTTLFLDHDGVLVDTEPFFAEAERLTLAEMGLPFDEEMSKAYGLSDNKEIYGLLLDKGFNEAEARAAQKRARDIYAEIVAGKEVVLPHVHTFLEWARGRFTTLALTTATERRFLDIIHAETGVREYFDFEVRRDHVTESKPDPACYHLALQYAQVPASACLVVEDSPRGTNAAAQAGIEVMAIPTETTQGLDFSRATYVLAGGLKAVQEILLEGK